MRRLLSAGLVVALAALAALWLWARPRADVPLPGPEATPEQVAAAYVAAVNGRDFDTANAIHVGDRENPWVFGRFERAPRMDNLRIGTPVDEKAGTPAERGHGAADSYAQAWNVPVEFDFSGGDASMADGRMTWGFILARKSETERWRIIDEGSG
ncbi:hypothetical protein ACQP1U_17600 [Actinomycetota bacterium]